MCTVGWDYVITEKLSTKGRIGNCERGFGKSFERVCRIEAFDIPWKKSVNSLTDF